MLLICEEDSRKPGWKQESKQESKQCPKTSVMRGSPHGDLTLHDRIGGGEAGKMMDEKTERIERIERIERMELFWTYPTMPGEDGDRRPQTP